MKSIPSPGSPGSIALKRAAAQGDEVARERLSVARFVARHALEPREAVLADAAPFVGMSPEERARHVAAACRAAAAQVAAGPYRERILERRDPPHPSYDVIVKRLRQRPARRRAP